MPATAPLPTPQPETGERRRVRNFVAAAENRTPAESPTGEGTPARRLPRSPASARQNLRDSFLRSAWLGAPLRIPWSASTYGHRSHIAPAPAVSRDLPPKPARRFSALGAAGCTAAPTLERPHPWPSEPYRARACDLPRPPASAAAECRNLACRGWANRQLRVPPHLRITRSGGPVGCRLRSPASARLRVVYCCKVTPGNT
jgi:hypothetical protein